MANVLDMLGRAALRIGGMTPQQIRQQARANKPSKPMPKPRGSKPTAKPAPPKPERIDPKGQTNLFNQSGKPRDFRNPSVSANRQPTLSPVESRGGQATPPNRPSGGFGAKPNGQRSLFGDNPTAKPGGTFRAPNVPNAREGIRQFSQGAKDWVAQNSRDARINEAVKGANRGKLAGSLGRGLEGLALLGAVADQTQKVFNPKDNLLTSLGDLGNTLSNGGRPGPGHSRYQQPQPSGPMGPELTPKMVSDYRSARDQRHAELRSQMPPAAPRSPAAGAPIHSAPRQFASAAPSAFAPQVGAAPRPNTPQPSINKAAENPYAGIGDVRGQQFDPGASNMEGAKVAQNPDMPDFGGNSLPGIDENGIDMERRRAFLDAKDSMSGMDAVRELLKRRKLSITMEH